VSLDPSAKREILDAIETAIRGFEENARLRHEEAKSAIHTVQTATVNLSERFESLTLRVEALEGSRSAHESRLSGHDASIRDGIADAKRLASDVASDVEGTLAGIDQRYSELADGLEAARTEFRTGLESVTSTTTAIKTDVDEMKTNVDRAVLRVLAKHVRAIEDAASKLTKSPQVKTAASVGGAFAGSASIAALFELLRALHVIH
jgi:chromosome segregation ATPase